VRLQLSTLFVAMTTRANFWARKFSSLVVFEQLKMPKAFGPYFSTERRKPLAVRSRASSQLAGRKWPLSRTSGVVSLGLPEFAIDGYLLTYFQRALQKVNAGGADIDFYVGAPKQPKPNVRGADIKGNVCATP
jgi:hypothetical protein